MVAVYAGLYVLGAVVTHLFLRTEKDPGGRRVAADESREVLPV